MEIPLGTVGPSEEFMPKVARRWCQNISIKENREKQRGSHFRLKVSGAAWQSSIAMVLSLTLYYKDQRGIKDNCEKLGMHCTLNNILPISDTRIVKYM